ncbi:outer membrane receptor protein [Burkholderiales bacterium JOSHI_001]|nr:outer membrane receptor protein [Burkholderiales bacterium JOSHI_001]
MNFHLFPWRSRQSLPKRPLRLGLFASACSFTLAASAQSSAAAAADATPTVVITGNPLRRNDLDRPVNSLGGDELQRRRAATLGETLDGLPGLAGSGFGPNASRPVIRGLDGDRVRLLDNAGASIDASNLSFDHAVALDPLVVERVEVLRGPAALLYGGNATGGVVNTIDNRIPRAPASGIGGRAELRGGGAVSERTGAAVLEGGQGAWAWHADAFGRRTSDLAVPTFTPVRDGAAEAPTQRVANSAAQARGGALGASWFGSGMRLGAAVDSLRNVYGVVVEPDVTIHMQRERALADGEWTWRQGPFSRLKLNGSHTRYQHDEVEGDGSIGTRFSSTGQDLRLELQQAARGPWQGVLGAQFESMRFSALGEEAFVPGTRTRSAALFTLQQLDLLPAITLSGGLRTEQVKVSSDGDPAGAAELRFGAAASRRFSPVSATVSLDGRFAPGWSASATLGHTERAPAYYELYANGVHVATAAYERGDTSLDTERSRHLELGLRWRDADQEVKLQAFQTRFARFIALQATGTDIDTGDGSTVPEYAFRSVRARMHGLELEARTAWNAAAWRWGVNATLDLVHGTDLDSQQPLPRLPPRRVGLGLSAQQGPWLLGLDLRHLAAQRRVPALDLATPAATLANLFASWRQALAGGAEALWTLKLENAGNALAYNASAVRTVRELSPLPGRALSASVRVNF